MDSILIVSSSEKSIAFFLGLLSEQSYNDISTVQSCNEARRLLLERDFDLCIINAPLLDENGTEFALDVSINGICQVILIVKSEMFEEISAQTEDSGIYTLAKPLSRQVFWSALKFAGAAHGKIAKMKIENEKLLQRIEDMRIIDRAKCILIERLEMTEYDAHRYIEKQAMDMRMTRKQIAQAILDRLG